MSSIHIANLFGVNAGQEGQQERAIAMGRNAGQKGQGAFSVAMGSNAGQVTQGFNAIAMGSNAGQETQGPKSVAMGPNAGQVAQGQNAVALGSNAGQETQGANSVALGPNAGQISQGAYSVAMGFGAGNKNQPERSIVINASGRAVNGATAGGFFVVPVREHCGGALTPLFYDANTGEITYQKMTEPENKQNTIVLSDPVARQDPDVASTLLQLSQQIDELRQQNAMLREHLAYIVVTSNTTKTPLMPLNFYDINSVRGLPPPNSAETQASTPFINSLPLSLKTL
jgi:hypothetical protein